MTARRERADPEARSDDASSQGKIRLLEESFQVFLGALLRMKADGIVIGRLSDPDFATGRGKISLGFIDPFTGQGLHKAPGRVEGFL